MNAPVPETKEQKKKRANRKSLILAFVYIVLLLLSIGAVVPVLSFVKGVVGFGITYSKGVRVGQIVKISDRGLIWKTHESQLALTQSGMYLSVMNFSIDPADPKSAENLRVLNEALDSGKIVKVNYIQKWGALPWHGETAYFIDEIEVTDHQAPIFQSEKAK